IHRLNQPSYCPERLSISELFDSSICRPDQVVPTVVAYREAAIGFIARSESRLALRAEKHRWASGGITRQEPGDTPAAGDPGQPALAARLAPHHPSPRPPTFKPGPKISNLP